ncbi:MAG: hypothetical protein WC683_02005 [bacterium]
MPQWNYAGEMTVSALEPEEPLTVVGDDGEHAIRISVRTDGCLQVEPMIREGCGEDAPLLPVVDAPISFSALIKKCPTCGA